MALARFSIVVRLFIILVMLTASGELIVRMLFTLPAATAPDSELGWVYRPHAKVLHSKEGRAFNVMNAYGFNDSQPNDSKARWRVVVMGDSFTEALQVPAVADFTSTAERLAPCVDFYNTGRSGLSPIFYPTILNRLCNSYQADYAVVAMGPGDATDILAGHYKEKRDPYTDKLKRIIPTPPPLGSLRVKLDPLLNRSALATYLSQRLKALMVNYSPEPDQSKSPATLKPLGQQHLVDLLVHSFTTIDQSTPLLILYHDPIDYQPNRQARVATAPYDYKKGYIRESQRSIRV